MITLTAPKTFHFDQTIQMLQRGEIDPINIINEACWTRVFRFSDKIVLIKTIKNKKITSEILCGELDNKTHKILISESLGLDDPILKNKVTKIPNNEKIADVIGLAVPGYPDLFEAIVQIIMGQQVSVTAANKIRANFTNQFGGNVFYENKFFKHFPYPLSILNLSIESLRSVGLSQTKAKSILQVAKAFVDDAKIQQLTCDTDKQIRQSLTQLHGVGDWTVDWLLLRGFRRFEIIPSTDLAVRKAFSWWLNKKVLMSAEAVKRYEKKLYPYGGVIAYRVLSAYSQIQKRKGDV